MFGCVWGWTHGCRCLWRSEGSDPREMEQQAVVSNWRLTSFPPNRVTEVLTSLTLSILLVSEVAAPVYITTVMFWMPCARHV